MGQNEAKSPKSKRIKAQEAREIKDNTEGPGDSQEPRRRLKSMSGMS
jgi:hypothetical protein